jgi:hypothetical protein
MKRQGLLQCQIEIPNRHLTERRGNTITIANIRGVLTKYRVVERAGVERLRLIA